MKLIIIFALIALIVLSGCEFDTDIKCGNFCTKKNLTLDSYKIDNQGIIKCYCFGYIERDNK